GGVVDEGEGRVGGGDVLGGFWLGTLTLIRVVVLIALASAIWVPVGVWIGLRPWAAERAQPLAQLLAAFPANVLFPIAVVAIVSLRLDPDIWLSPLMVLGTQWYLLFHVIAGASAFPTDLPRARARFRPPCARPRRSTGCAHSSGGAT